LVHAGRERHFLSYTPSRATERPALVLVFHASRGSGARARAAFGYEFDRLAESAGFIVVYPDGFEGHWNDCRRAGPYSANRLQVDDVGFTRALVDHFVREQAADRRRVFATGLSNGGQMALRLALEAPELVRAVAPVAASLPTGGNMDCQTLGRPVSILLMNGTADPMNPYEGGEVALFGWLGSRGHVLSTQNTIDYWRELAASQGPPQLELLPDRDAGDHSRVERRSWREPGHKAVVLDTIVGGGHTLPNPELRMPRLLGPTNGDLVAAREIWRFFESAP